MGPTGNRGAFSCPWATRLLGGGEVLEHLVGLVWLEAAVDDGADGADHGGGIGGLEDVAAHVDAGGRRRLR